MWITRNNQELNELYKTPDLLAHIRRGRRLAGLWRGMRMDQTSEAQRISESKSEGRRKATRPRLNGCKMKRMITGAESEWMEAGGEQ